jgi:hypothetical protein
MTRHKTRLKPIYQLNWKNISRVIGGRELFVLMWVAHER